MCAPRRRLLQTSSTLQTTGPLQLLTCVFLHSYSCAAPAFTPRTDHGGRRRLSNRAFDSWEPPPPAAPGLCFLCQPHSLFAVPGRRPRSPAPRLFCALLAPTSLRWAGLAPGPGAIPVLVGGPLLAGSWGTPGLVAQVRVSYLECKSDLQERCPLRASQRGYRGDLKLD